MAFAASTFLGAAPQHTQAQHVAGARPGAMRMAAAKPAGRSSVFEAFWKGQSAGLGSMPAGSRVPVEISENNVLRASLERFRDLAAAQQGAGGDARAALQPPFMMKADDYVASCARRQYIAKTNGSGVYGLQCTEGSAKFAADDARVAVLAAEYRAKRIPAVTSFADLFEARRRATVLAQGCSYEEKLVATFAASASAVVQGSSEASRACVRYADPAGPAEKYMVDCVSRAASARAAAGGLYGVMCCDGTVKGAAEQKRVAGLSVQFRNGQKSQLEKEAAKFEVARFARENYAHLCSYEEDLFNKYPATGAAMRPDSARY